MMEQNPETIFRLRGKWDAITVSIFSLRAVLFLVLFLVIGLSSHHLALYFHFRKKQLNGHRKKNK